MMNRCKWLLILLLTGSMSAWAGESREGLWGFGSFYGTAGSWLYDFQPQLRFVWGGNDVNQSLASLGFGKRLSSPWEAWAGVTYQLTDQDAPGIAHEYRVWEEMDYYLRRPRFNLVVRSRLEERMAEGYSSVSNRLRERVTLTHPVNDNWRVVTYNEVFVNLNQVPWVVTPSFDQNRTYLGFEYQLTRAARTGAGYLLRYFPTTPAQTDNILMFTLQVNMDILEAQQKGQFE